eukprot:8280948-Ditylum_brightwellii.AAC.1
MASSSFVCLSKSRSERAVALGCSTRKDISISSKFSGKNWRCGVGSGHSLFLKMGDKMESLDD